MKMTWKKKISGDAKNKARKRPISSDLPFEDLDSTSHADNEAQSQLPTNNKTSPLEEEDQKTKNLAMDFQAQGNKLAEVLLSSPSIRPF